MIEEKTRRSKMHHNKEMEVCAKSVQSPIVLLQRLHIGANGPTLIKAAVTDKLSNSVKCDKTDTSLAGEQKSKKCRLRNSSAAVLNDSTSNDKSSIQCTTAMVNAAASQSTSPDLNGGNAISKTTSFKYKKKLKRLEKTTLGLVTDKKLSEKISDSPKLSSDTTAAQKTKISITVSTRKKQAEKAGADDKRKSTVINDSDANSSQEQVSNGVSSDEHVFDNSRLLNGNSTAEKTAQVKTPMPTRNKLLRSTEADDCKQSSIQNSLADSSTTNISQLVNGKSSLLEKESHINNVSDSNSVGNSARNTISTRNKLHQVNKTDKSNECVANASPLKVSNGSPNVEKIEKLIPVNEIADTIKNNSAENTIKTRSKLNEEGKAGNIESPSVAKSRLKKISNKPALTGNVVEQEVKETDSISARDNNNTKKPISTRSTSSDAKKTDDNNESFVKNDTAQSKLNDLKINVSKVTASSKSESIGKASDNLKITNDTTMGKITPVKGTISARTLQLKVIIDDCEKLKTRKSAIRNQNTGLDQSSSSTVSSQTQINGHSPATLENGVTQPGKTNSTPSTPHMQIDNESFTNESVLDRSKSTVGASIVEKKINKGERISTRSKTSVTEKIVTENDALQTEKVKPTSAVTSEKSLTKAKLNDTPKSVAKTLKTKESNDISTKSRSLEKVKSDDNKKFTIEKSSDNVTIQPEQNQKVSTPIKVQINNEISHSTRSPKKVNVPSTLSTRSKIEKSKTDNQENSILENKTVRLEQNNSTPESLAVQITELIPNDTVQNNLKPSIDLPKTKESTPIRSKLHEKKENENKMSPTDENAFSKKSKMLEKSKNDDHIGGTLKNTNLNLDKDNVISDSPAAVVISNKSVENENILGSPKQVANSTKSQKKVDIKITRSTRSRLFESNGTDNQEKSIVENGVTSVKQTDCTLNSSQAKKSIVENGVTSVKQTDSTLNSSQAKGKSESTINAPADVDNSSNTTRSGLTRKPSDARPQERKTKSLVEKSPSPSKSQEPNESICDMNGQQRVCYEKEVVIKLFRCDQAQPAVNRLIEKEAPKKKMLRGKRKAESETPVEETPKAKKSKLDDSSKDLPITNDNQSLAVDNQVQVNISKETGKSAVASQSNVESEISDINVTKGIENVSKNHEETEKDSCSKNVSDISVVDNSISKKTTISKKANQCDNKRVENEKEIIVNSSGDNISVHGDELLEDRDEGISVDTSENETNVETPTISDNLVVEKSPPTTATREKESHDSLARRIVEEVMNDWDVADDDKTDDIDSTGVNQDVSTPEVIQIDDNDDVEMIEPEEVVSIGNATDKSSSQIGIATPRKNTKVSGVAVSNSPRVQTEKRITVTDVRSIESNQSADMEKETRGTNSTSEHTSEMSEFEEVDDSNFESVDEGSSTEAFANDEQEDNVSQETITYYNSEDISMDVGVSVNDNRLNDVVMNLKDACDKITADLRRVDTSYENNEETPNHQEPEVLCISDDSNGEQEEEEEEVMIIEPTDPMHEPTVQIHEPTVEIHEPEPSFSDHQPNFLYSNPYHHAMHQGSPSISVIKASELRDDMLQPPVEYPVKPTEPHVVYPQRQMMRSTTLLPASMMSDAQTSSLFTEDTIMQCPKCRCDFVGKSRLRRHWLTCGDAMYLYCPFCTNKVKQRRSLVNHLNTQHSDQVNPEEAVKIAQQIVKQTREAAGVKLKQGSHLAIQDFIRSSCPVPIIELPSFIRIQCVVCNKLYEEIPATYKKICDDCSSDLMTAICQLCRKQYMLSSKIALHVQGNCIYSGRVTCRECGFESSGRYHLQEHIIRKHIYVAPEDYVTCSHGCGKTFRVQDQLKKHERVCVKEPTLDCKYCEYKTKNRAAMRSHEQRHVENDEGRLLEVVQGDEDVRDLITEQQVRSVIRVHCSRCNRNLRLTSNRSSCEYCKLSFTFSCSRCSDSHRLDSLHAARLHVIRSHSVKIHECPHCSEKFSYVYDLTRHASQCIAKFSCEYCNYRTDRENKLRDHARRVHPAALLDSLHCKKCGKWFTRLDSLRRHEMRNCGIVPRFSCEHCQFKTKTKYSLLRHIQRQHAYIYKHFSFVCNRCDKFYNNIFAYEVHVKNCHELASN